MMGGGMEGKKAKKQMTSLTIPYLRGGVERWGVGAEQARRRRDGGESPLASIKVAISQ